MLTKAEKTRQHIIEKAAVLFNKNGMAGTSISDIMQVTNLAKGGIYGNFENKEEICLEVFKYLSKNLLDLIDAALNSRDSAKDKLYALLDFYEDALLYSDKGGCPVLNFGTEADDTNPVIKQAVNKTIKDTQDRITRVISDGIENGEFSPSVNAGTFAVKMYLSTEGAILVGRIQNSNQQMKIINDILKAEIEAFSQ
jgi:TetR/AcrR family transcriptional regulator, transcriptional repressor for nem operon